ncbi:DUF397 domain-containing protein [Streptomyces sp. NPDC046821]|uniref:DUF397 domain-containing protein n=1 Tax=Streptomyces sp. NPDC046821 TaxID=3154702 RepID=UPI0033F07DBC
MSARRRYAPSTAVPSTALHDAPWRRSSRSTGMNNCVETAPLSSGPTAGLFAVRDSKRTAGPALLFSPSAWEGFLSLLR